MKRHNLKQYDLLDVPHHSLDLLHLQDLEQLRNLLASFAGKGGPELIFGLCRKGVLAVRSQTTKRAADLTRHSAPPESATFLLYLFLSKKNRKAIPGDLAEEYRQIVLPKFGPRKANLWYWGQVVRSIGPVVRAWLRKVAILAGLGKVAQEILRSWSF